VWRCVLVAPIIEYVFEECGENELLDLMGAAQQAERAAFARQLLAVGRFTLRRMEQTAGEHDIWCVDDGEAVAAEVGAEFGDQPGAGVLADALRQNTAGALPRTECGVSGRCRGLSGDRRGDLSHRPAHRHRRAGHHRRPADRHGAVLEHPVARPTRRTAEFITCSRRFTPGLPDGPRHSGPTAPSPGPHHARTPTPPHPPAPCFSQLGLPTQKLALAMPTRKRTRTQDRAHRIECERARNRARSAADPPPF